MIDIKNIGNSKKRKTNKERSYEYLSSSSHQMSKFNKKTSHILSQIINENKAINEHAKNIMRMNDELVEENKILLSENMELKELLKGVSNMVYVTCPFCNTDKNIIVENDEKGESIIHKLITKGECISTCYMCNKDYKIYNGEESIETSSI